MKFYAIIAALLLFLISNNITAQDYENVTLLSQWSDDNLPTINNGIRYNEVWGFVQGGEEYAVIGSTNGAHIFRITAGDQLEEVDFVPGAFQGDVVHRHYDDYNGYLYAVCDQGNSTLQVIDLQYLPDSVSVVYDSNELVVRAHNCFVDRSSGILYLAGPAGNALRLLSLENPAEPTFISNFDQVTYVHDLFVRNDTAYLNAANQGLLVVNFENPTSPVQLGSLTTYQEQGYNHSGWLSEDGDTYVFADETQGMRMKVCDVSDLSDIQVLSLFNSEVSASTVPHNLQVKNNLVYVSHYNDGLQVFDITDPASPIRVAFYDTFSGENQGPPYAFNGAWGIYAFLPSERILISDRTSGLYLFRIDLTVSTSEIIQAETLQLFPNPCLNELNVVSAENLRQINIYNLAGQLVLQPAVSSNAGNAITIDISMLPSSVYVVEAVSENKITRSNLIKF
jgi:choice-of-anchor B domain-containing protein